MSLAIFFLFLSLILIEVAIHVYRHLYYIGLSISRQPHFAIFLAYYAVLNALDQNSDGVQIHFYA